MSVLYCPHEALRRCNIYALAQCGKAQVCMRALIVEDDTSYGLLLKTQLQHIFGDMTATVSSTLTEAIAAVQRDDYDLIFLDVRLPDAANTTGLRLLLRAVVDVPIVVITGWDDYEAPAFLDIGAEAFLLKQNATREVIAAVTRKALHMPPA